MRLLPWCLSSTPRRGLRGRTSRHLRGRPGKSLQCAPHVIRPVDESDAPLYPLVEDLDAARRRVRILFHVLLDGHAVKDDRIVEHGQPVFATKGNRMGSVATTQSAPHTSVHEQ